MGKSNNEIPETEQERELARVSIEKWNDHQKRMVPLENKIIEDANRSTTAQGMKAGGQVNADMAQATAPALNTVNPNSGKALTSAPALAIASKTAQAQVKAGQGVEDQRASALGNVVRMGEGKSAAATAGYETAASNASSEAINSAAANATDRATALNTVGSLAGIGAYAYDKTNAVGKAATTAKYPKTGGNNIFLNGDY
mgnify:CR=1 FL=1